jgi:hypothetical protein
MNIIANMEKSGTIFFQCHFFPTYHISHILLLMKVYEHYSEYGKKWHYIFSQCHFFPTYHISHILSLAKVYDYGHLTLFLKSVGIRMMSTKVSTIYTAICYRYVLTFADVISSPYQFNFIVSPPF